MWLLRARRQSSALQATRFSSVSAGCDSGFNSCLARGGTTEVGGFPGRKTYDVLSFTSNSLTADDYDRNLRSSAYHCVHCGGTVMRFVSVLSGMRMIFNIHRHRDSYRGCRCSIRAAGGRSLTSIVQAENARQIAKRDGREYFLKMMLDFKYAVIEKNKRAWDERRKKYAPSAKKVDAAFTENERFLKRRLLNTMWSIPLWRAV